MNHPVISPVQPHEHERLVEVWEASVRATHDFLPAGHVEALRPLVREGLPQLTLVCVRDGQGQLVGFAGVEGRKLEALFIDPDQRGQGLGRTLVRHVVDVLGVTELDVNEQNGQAVGFYQRMGFEIVGRSELDGQGNPFPLLHMRLKGAGSPALSP